MAASYRAAMWLLRRVRFPVCLVLLAPLTIKPGTVPPRPLPPVPVTPQLGARYVDSVLIADLSGKGRPVQIEFYHRGPIPGEKPHQEHQYVRGIEVVSDDGAVLARWESPPTAFPCLDKASACFSPFDRVWNAAPARGSLITTAALYEHGDLRLWAFRWNGGQFIEVGNWHGEDFAIRQLPGRLIVSVKPTDYDKLPQLYAWDGGSFVEVSGKVPGYYARLGDSYAAAISHHRSSPASLVHECQLALEAYNIAHQIESARDACDKAKDRIKSGQGIVSSSRHTSRGQFTNERLAAVSQIDDLMKLYGDPSR